MGERIQLHNELIRFCPNAYFQPPAGYQLTYPCIIYRRSDANVKRANNQVYGIITGYEMTVIDRNPESKLATDILQHFPMCDIGTVYTVDNLYHTPLSLFY